MPSSWCSGTAATGSGSHPATADQPRRAPGPPKAGARRPHKRVPDRRLTAVRCYEELAGQSHVRVFEPNRIRWRSFSTGFLRSFVSIAIRGGHRQRQRRPRRGHVREDQQPAAGRLARRPPACPHHHPAGPGQERGLGRHSASDPPHPDPGRQRHHPDHPRHVHRRKCTTPSWSAPPSRSPEPPSP